MNKFEKEYMHGGKDMFDSLYSLFRKATTEMRMDDSDDFRELDERFNMVISKWAEMRAKELIEELQIV